MRRAMLSGLAAGGLLALGAAALILAAPDLAPPAAPTEAAPAAAISAAAAAPPPARPATRLEAFLARPPFSAARRPPPPPAPAAVAAPAPSGLLFGRYAVTGVVSAEGAPVALLRDVAAGVLLRLRRGERLGEAVLVDIDLAQLTFRVGDDTVTADVGTLGRNR